MRYSPYIQCQKVPHNLLKLKHKGLTEYLRRRQGRNRERPVEGSRHYLTLNTICVIFFVDTYYMCGINSLTSIFNSVLIGKPFTVSFLIFVII